MKRKISWNIKIQLYLPPKNRNFSLKVRKEIMIGVNEDEVKLNSKTREKRKQSRKKTQMWSSEAEKNALICDPLTEKYHGKIS